MLPYHHMLPFAIPYPPEQPHGFWGIPTSTIDWCEENYVVSPFVAEALNTITNAVFIALAVFAIVSTYRNHLELRFQLLAFGFLLVGIGLWLFHMTLRYEYQLLDELPMIYATCIPFWSVFSEFRTTRQSVFVGIGIFSAANLLTMIYLKIKDPTLHQAAYGILNAAIILESTRLAGKHVPDALAQKQMKKTMITGITLFASGYILWNLDIHLCLHVRATRREWGMPYGFLLEGHGWWHILTGSGVYFYLVYLEYLRCWLTGTQKFFEFRWVYGLPVVVLTDLDGLSAHRAAAKTKKTI